MDENCFPRHQYLLGKKCLDQIIVLLQQSKNKIKEKEGPCPIKSMQHPEKQQMGKNELSPFIRKGLGARQTRNPRRQTESTSSRESIYRRLDTAHKCLKMREMKSFFPGEERPHLQFYQRSGFPRRNKFWRRVCVPQEST
ncbi:hypothetical protein TNCV_3503961 [Trichonephila clavipes]|uniref:Uncharacterized protein n=1 Tax=Trichonephila clavipes TaxID=2585209 RepID=A0A8X6RXJ4_TRICX|nr:hypothetical protein TNCV_3503961 [Trichonephila clavipes]